MADPVGSPPMRSYYKLNSRVPDPNAAYRVTTNSFVADSGDQLYPLKKGDQSPRRAIGHRRADELFREISVRCAAATSANQC
jgi:hypothetical protein